MKLEAVNSSLLSELGYDAATQTAYARFAKGQQLYAYYNMPQSVFDEWKAAESVGQFFLRNIKPTYNFAKVDE